MAPFGAIFYGLNDFARRFIWPVAVFAQSIPDDNHCIRSSLDGIVGQTPCDTTTTVDPAGKIHHKKHTLGQDHPSR